MVGGGGLVSTFLAPGLLLADDALARPSGSRRRDSKSSSLTSSELLRSLVDADGSGGSSESRSSGTTFCQSVSVLDRCMSGGERSCRRSSSSSVKDRGWSRSVPFARADRDSAADSIEVRSLSVWDAFVRRGEVVECES